jgi:TAP-like protein
MTALGQPSRRVDLRRDLDRPQARRPAGSPPAPGHEWLIGWKLSAASADRWWAGWSVPNARPGRPAAPTATPAPGMPPPSIRSWVIGTRFDPVTPLRNARLAARRLGNADLVVHDGCGHLTRRDPAPASPRPSAATWSTSPPHRRGPSAPLTAAPSTPTSANPSPSRSCWEACTSGPWTTAGAAALQSSGTMLIGRGGLCEPMPWQSATRASRRASSPRSVGATAVPSRVARWGGRSLPRRPAGRKAAAATRG